MDSFGRYYRKPDFWKKGEPASRGGIFDKDDDFIGSFEAGEKIWSGHRVNLPEDFKHLCTFYRNYSVP